MNVGLHKDFDTWNCFWRLCFLGDPPQGNNDKKCRSLITPPPQIIYSRKRKCQVLEISLWNDRTPCNRLCFQYDLYWASTAVTFNINQRKVANCACQRGSPMNKSPFSMHQWGKHNYSYIAFLRLREFCVSFIIFGSVGSLHNTSQDIPPPKCPPSNSLGNWPIPQVHTISCIWITQRLRREHPELACSSLILHKVKYNVWSPHGRTRSVLKLSITCILKLSYGLTFCNGLKY